MGPTKVKWIVSVSLVAIFVFSVFCSVNICAEPGKDSDYDGWSDEYEKTIGTDPYNHDTDGDGIRDPDDPTPKGSLVSEEEVWETF